MATVVSSKNTKTEILEAYENLLEEVQKAKANHPKLQQEEKQNKEISDRVSDLSKDNLKRFGSMPISAAGQAGKSFGCLCCSTCCSQWHRRLSPNC